MSLHCSRKNLVAYFHPMRMRNPIRLRWLSWANWIRWKPAKLSLPQSLASGTEEREQKYIRPARKILAGFHRIWFARESHSGRMGFVILIGWKYVTRFFSATRPTLQYEHDPTEGQFLRGVHNFLFMLFIRKRSTFLTDVIISSWINTMKTRK